MVFQPMDVEEFTAVSELEWGITILAKSDWEKNFIVKSKEVNFMEAGATWSLQLSSCSWGTNNIFVVSKFVLNKMNFDKNATFKFDILLKDGTIMSSPLFSILNPTFEYEMKQYIPVQEGDLLEITPRVSFYTLKLSDEIPAFALKGLNDALEAMKKKEEEEEAKNIKVAFEALKKVTENMTSSFEELMGIMDAEDEVFKFENQNAEVQQVVAQEADSDTQENQESETQETESATQETGSGTQETDFESQDSDSDSQFVPISQDTIIDSDISSLTDEEFDEEFYEAYMRENKDKDAVYYDDEEDFDYCSDDDIPDDVQDVQQLQTESDDTEDEKEIEFESAVVSLETKVEVHQDQAAQSTSVPKDFVFIDLKPVNEEGQKAMEVLNKALAKILGCKNEQELEVAFSELTKIGDNTEVMKHIEIFKKAAEENALKVAQEKAARKAEEEAQKNAKVERSDTCSDIEVIPDENATDEEFDNCSDSEGRDLLRKAYIDAQIHIIDAKNARIAQGNKKEAIKNRHSAEYEQNAAYRTEVTVKERCCEGNCPNPPVDDESMSHTLSIDLPNIGKINLPSTDPSDLALMNQISEIYLGNMKMIAEASATLFIYAAKSGNQKMLEDCSNALAAQMNLKNFPQIWNVGDKLKIIELKKKAIKFANDNKGWYDLTISPEMMRDYVNSKN